MFSLMWTEHCAYKHSRKLLRALPTEGARVVHGPGRERGRRRRRRRPRGGVQGRVAQPPERGRARRRARPRRRSPRAHDAPPALGRQRRSSCASACRRSARSTAARTSPARRRWARAPSSGDQLVLGVGEPELAMRAHAGPTARRGRDRLEQLQAVGRAGQRRRRRARGAASGRRRCPPRCDTPAMSRSEPLGLSPGA